MTIERWPVPSTWRWKELGEIGKVVGGGTPSTRDPENFASPGIPWITPADLSGFSEKYISQGKRFLSPRGLGMSGATLIPPGSVLFSSRAPIGYCAVAKNEMTTSQGFKSLILFPMMSSDYVFEYLRGSAEYAESRARGTTFKELSASRFSKLRIPVPPADEQIRIAKRLQGHRHSLDQTDAEIKLAKTLTVNIRRAILRHAFSGHLTRNWRQQTIMESSEELLDRMPLIAPPTSGRGATDRVVKGSGALHLNAKGEPLPPGWSWQPLARLAQQETGHTPSRSNREYWDGGIPWVGIRDAGRSHGHTLTSTLQSISELGLENSSARMLPEGTVLLSRTASIGYVCQLGAPMATSQDFVAWICGPGLNPTYLKYLMMGERDFLKRIGRGTTHSTIYLPEIRAFSIALAPLEEQNEIVRRLDIFFEQLEQAEAEIETASILTSTLNKRLYSLAFRGKLEPQSLGDGNVDEALVASRMEWMMTIQSRPKEKKLNLGRNRLPVSQQLAELSEFWPESGITYEDLKDSLVGNYDEIRSAIFKALREKRISQRFDLRRRMMVFSRGAM